MKSLRPTFLAISALLLGTGSALLLPSSVLAGASSAQTGEQLPVEKIISIARERKPSMRIINTFKETNAQGKVVDKVFYFQPDAKETRVMSLNPVTGKILEDRAYKLPEKQQTIPLENLLTELKSKYPMKKIIRTRTDRRDGRDVRMIVYLDKLEQRRVMVVDAKTGEVLSDKARKLN